MITAFNSPPFDIHEMPLLTIESADQYYEFCQKYFKICHQKKVLEIGCYDGRHSEKIIQNKPDQLQVIEGDVNQIEKLQSIKGINHIISDDVMLCLQNPMKFDVVICFGVLYHLHSPLHLLELIVNNCRPDFIALDCTMSPETLQFMSEEINISGSCQTRKGWMASRLNIVVPFLTYLQAMDNLGYKCIDVDRITVKNHFPKSHSWIACWEKKQ